MVISLRVAKVLFFQKRKEEFHLSESPPAAGRQVPKSKSQVLKPVNS
jgi:hypothetical protein